MPEFNNTFISGSMNKDLDERLIPKNQYRDALNIDVTVSKGEDAGVAKNKMGNTRSVDIADLSGRVVVDPITFEELAKTIGAVEYEAFNKIYWFVACDTFDGIYEYDEPTGTAVRVLQSNKATPSTPSKLNFRKEYPITGVNFIRGNDENNYLYWTDDYNPPRRINITRVKSDPSGVSGYQVDDPRIDNDIDVVLAPPLFAPSIFLYNDNSVNDTNNLSEKFLYFSYRYKYVDDQYSAMSPFSAVSFMPKEYEYDYGVGNNKSMTNFYNSVRISFETGDEFVEEIQVFVRDTKNINVGIVDTFSKSENPDILDNSSYTITFNNNKVYAALPNDQVTRLYDNVPLLAKAQDVVGNRISYGNYVQFRDIVNCSGNDININYQLSIKNPPSVAATEADPKSTWRSDRDYEIGLVYLDDYGRMSTVLTAPATNPANGTSNTIFVPPANSSTPNTLVLSIKNEPPCWATHYRVYVKQSKKSYYNVFPILYYSDGLFRYFLINESELSKINVGEYVIFKATSAGATNSNKKYKVLEVESKPANFLSGGSTEIAGLYFKIKVDSSTELSGIGVQNYTSTGIGGTDYNFSPQRWAPDPFRNNDGTDSQGFTYIDNPIYYGDSNENGITLFNDTFDNFQEGDIRITIQIDSPTTYSIYKNSIGLYSFGNYNQLIDSNLPISTGIPTVIAFYFTVLFNQSTYNVGDRWIFNGRSFRCFAPDLTGADFLQNIGSAIAIVPGADWSETTPETDRKILTGAVIKIQVKEDTYNPSGSEQLLQPFPPSPQDYENIEEWWYESGARDLFSYINVNGGNDKGSRVRFRRGRDFGYFPGLDTTFNVNQVQFQDPSGAGLTNESKKYPLRMFIGSSMPDNPGIDGSFAAGLYPNGGRPQSKFVVSFEITQQENLNICETAPIEDDSDIYHELFQTYPIVNGQHQVLWHYDDYEAIIAGAFAGETRLRQFDKTVPHYFNVGDEINVVSTNDLLMPSGPYTILGIEDLYSVVLDFNFPIAGPPTPGTVSLGGVNEQDQNGLTVPAIIEINKPMSFNTDNNGWSWGNGLESDRIFDDFNQTTKGFSVRVQTPIENYRQIRNEASICYSGIYQFNTTLNRLNEFNLSTSNFRYLDRDFGSIQKLYATDTDLVVFQENKVSNVLYGKNILFDSIGGGQVVSIPEVLGTQIPVNGEWGISRNPESFAKTGDNVYFTDARRGVVLKLNNQIITEISSFGLNDYFRDLMIDNPTTQKIGAFDPYDNMYVLSTNNQSVVPCMLTLSRDSLNVTRVGPVGYILFNINTILDWTLSLEDTGYGTGWVTDYPTEGTGSQNVTATVAQNLTAANRTVKFVVEYCDGLTAEFILTQARGKKGRIIWYVLSNKDITL
jgi:hypothetical protein